ncbi:aminodeoxychorismate synthase component I [Acidicapsa ligni]|uniref:aminodeoxychorismate synthase component I n=1 Tax=Acidicapsa ligni TaxID=542300 RepID=UPI0021DFA2B3|nr:aminodeoxychorismate synthase component I [Acidicapsa ligni]
MTRYARLPAWVHAVVAENPGSVLLETARFDSSNRTSYLFSDPVQMLIAHELDEIPRIFTAMEEALAEGLFVAGYFGYECGYHFEPVALSKLRSQNEPLIWLGVYAQPHIFDHAEGRFLNDDPIRESDTQYDPERAPAIDAQSIALGISAEDYGAKIAKIQSYIAAGHTYQVNFTDRVNLKIQQQAAQLFAMLSAQQPVAYSAFLNFGDRQILSCSPELFFRIHDGKITTRPMKGTMPRGLNAEEDVQAAVLLQHDEKNRSEHVMIVDLLRNDLGRICEMGSVAVEDLFTVERYETLLQMTSTISGMLKAGIDYYEIFRGIFPSGSITGAPKVRTMQIIDELETRPRGVYTGAIGFIAPDRSSSFNVAIRTLVIENGSATLGVGGGIVADSKPMDEYQECLLKASFLTRVRHEFQLIETMLWDGEIRLLPLHLRRLEASASYFNFAFDRAVIEEQLQQLASSFDSSKRYRIRLLLARTGELTLTAQEFNAESPKGRIRFAPERTSSTDVFFRHKTTKRSLYDEQHARAREEGFDDVIFLNEKDQVTEGAISNIFIRQSGRLLTPPLSCGVLDGVYRWHLLETRADIEERIVTRTDLETADAIYLCNALRGIYEVKLTA